MDKPLDKREYVNRDKSNVEKGERIRIRPDSKILFIGDSITDVNRNWMDAEDLGNGYPMLIASYLLHKHPTYDLEILNRGVGGDRLVDLKNRWEKDCLDHNPDIVSILIGINDIWYAIDSDTEQLDEAALEKFEADYRGLLKSLAHRTDARVVLIEPYVLPYPKKRLTWRKHLDPRIQIVRQLANEYHAALIPLDGILNALGIENGYQTYTGDDGVHPTRTGHAAIADAWIKWLDV